MQGQYYLVCDSYYTIGQRLKLLQQNKVRALKNYMHLLNKTRQKSLLQVTKVGSQVK